MTKYTPLADYLRAHKGKTCSLTLVEIEEIIGGPLPASARKHPAWWGNDNTHTQAKAWLRAGFGAQPSKTHTDLIVFRPIQTQSEPSAPAKASGPTQVVVRSLTPDIIKALKRRASQAGHSLERELRNILSRAARPSREEQIVEARRIRAMTPGRLSDSALLIREDRDRR